MFRTFKITHAQPIIDFDPRHGVSSRNAASSGHIASSYFEDLPIIRRIRGYIRTTFKKHFVQSLSFAACLYLATSLHPNTSLLDWNAGISRNGYACHSCMRATCETIARKSHIICCILFSNTFPFLYCSEAIDINDVGSDTVH